MTLQAERARDAAGGKGIAVGFTLGNGWLTRHASLSGGETLPDEVRARAATAIAAVPGVGGASWRGGRHTRTGEQGELPVASVAMHCQLDVEAVLDARSIRFAEASDQIDAASEEVLDEVAAALEDQAEYRHKDRSVAELYGV